MSRRRRREGETHIVMGTGLENGLGKCIVAGRVDGRPWHHLSPSPSSLPSATAFPTWPEAAKAEKPVPKQAGPEGKEI